MSDRDKLEEEMWETFRAVARAEGMLSEAEAERTQAISSWLHTFEGDEFWAQVTDFYWDHYHVPVDELAEAVGMPPAQLKHHVGGHLTDVPCDECGRQILATSRSHLKQLRGFGKTGRNRKLCAACEKAQWADRPRFYRGMKQEHDSRVNELRKMPYREYLQTPEWRSRREQMVQEVGYRCQLCNRSGKTLHVHHRTYERRGDEANKDLIVLCADCHKRFHDESSVE